MPFQPSETWSSTRALVSSLRSHFNAIKVYNLYSNNGVVPKGMDFCPFSTSCLLELRNDYFTDRFRADYVLLLDYGVYDHPLLNKSLVPIPFILEAGDCPQSLKYHLQKIRKFDFCVSPDYESSLVLNSYIPTKWSTHCSDTSIFYPNGSAEIFDCVTTCGPRGNGLTEEIKSHFGDRFNNERYFYGKDYANRLNMGKIVFQCSQYKEITRRIFEGMSCGKLVITDRLPTKTMIDSLFIENEDIVYYDNAKDAIEKIEFYSNNNSERKRIAANGYNKVLNNHTYAHRAQDIMSLL